MMTRLLKLKKPIVDYFRRHSNNARKLTSHDWRVTNEVCSLLDVVAEVAIKVQEGADTHIGQTMFNMMETKEIFTEKDHSIRTSDETYDSSGGILKERMGVDDLSQEAQLVREVLLSKLEKKELRMARVLVERICALLDPRRKAYSAEHLVNGNAHLKTSAIYDVKNVAKTFGEPASSVSGVVVTAGTEGPAGPVAATDPSRPNPRSRIFHPT